MYVQLVIQQKITSLLMSLTELTDLILARMFG
jgi:hypothetical protein